MKAKRDMKRLQVNEIDDSDIIFNLTSQFSPPVLIELQLNGKNLFMGLDTVAAMILIYQSTYSKLFMNVELCSLDIIL